MSNNGNIIKKIIISEAADYFFLAVACATAFTAGMCHWLLEIEYKYRENIDPLLGIIDFHWIFVLCVIISSFYIIKKQKLKFDFALLMLLTSFLLIGVLDYHSQRYVEVCYAYIVPMAYLVGKLVVGQNAAKANYRIEKLYFSLAAGMFIAALMDFFSNYKYASTIGFSDGIWPSFWLGGIVDNRCTYEFGFFLITISTGYLIYCAKRNVFTIIIAMFFNLVIQKLVIEATGRENRAVLPAGVLLFIFLFLYDNWRKFSNESKQRVYNVMRIILLIIVLLFFGILTNIFGLRGIYNSSIWAARSGFFNNARFSMDWEGFKAMLQYPLEDYEMYAGLERPHSMILEYGRVYDLTIWGMLSITRLVLIKDAIIIASVKNTNSWIKYLLCPAFIAVNIYYSMEPNGYAHRHFWMVGLLISGMIRGWIEANNIEETKILDIVRKLIVIIKKHVYILIRVVLCIIIIVGVYKGIKLYDHKNDMLDVEKALEVSSTTLDSVELTNTAIYKVKIDGSGDYRTIGEAIAKAHDDDIILVYPGVYEENVNACSKRIHIIGTDKESCILSCSSRNETMPLLMMAQGSVTNMTISSYKNDGEINVQSWCVLISDPNSEEETLKFSNVNIYNENYGAVAIGLQKNFVLEFQNCDIESRDFSSLYCYDWVPESDEIEFSQELILRNCSLQNSSKSKPTVMLQSQELRTACAKCTFVGNNINNQHGEPIGMELRDNRTLTNDQFMGASDWILGEESSFNNIDILNYIK